MTCFTVGVAIDLVTSSSSPLIHYLLDKTYRSPYLHGTDDYVRLSSHPLLFVLSGDDVFILVTHKPLIDILLICVFGVKFVQDVVHI